MLHSTLLFLHVASAMGMFAALGAEAAALLQLPRAAVGADLGAALRGFWLVSRVGMPSLALTVLSGGYLATTPWRWRGAWIAAGVVGVVLTAIAGATMTRPGLARLGATAAAGGAAPPHTPRDRRADSLLWASFTARLTFLAGIVYLMTAKPGPAGSVATIAVAIVVALIAGYSTLRSTRAAGAAARVAS